MHVPMRNGIETRSFSFLFLFFPQALPHRSLAHRSRYLVDFPEDRDATRSRSSAHVGQPPSRLGRCCSLRMQRPSSRGYAAAACGVLLLWLGSVLLDAIHARAALATPREAACTWR